MIYNHILETTYDNSTAPQHQCFQVAPSLPIFPQIRALHYWMNELTAFSHAVRSESFDNEQLTGTYSLATNYDVGKYHKRLQLVRGFAPPSKHTGSDCGEAVPIFYPYRLLTGEKSQFLS
jgi:hypothetical protein